MSETTSNDSSRYGLYLFTVLITLFIVFLQFQNILAVPIKESRPLLSRILFLSDKIFFMVLLLTFVYIKFLGGFIAPDYRKIKRGFVVPLKSEIILLVALSAFVFWGLISAAFNQNNLLVTLNGIFAYVVYFLVFFVFSSIPYEESMIERVYLFLLRLALLLSMLSIMQEIFAFMYPSSVYWWPNIQIGETIWRMGFFRAPSFLGHPNSIGTFALFFFTIELARKNMAITKQNRLSIACLGLSIFFSVSRSAIGGSIIALFFLSRVFRKLVFILFPLALITAIIFWGYTERTKTHESAEILNYDEYRSFAMKISLDIIKDNPIFGVGPGMYGGHISLKYNSPVYAEYGFTGPHFDYLSQGVGSIEQQWLQALAELGILGVLFLIILILTPILILYRLYRLNKQNRSALIKPLIVGLMIMPLQMILYMFGFTLTLQSAWLVPYFVLVGMLVGNQRTKRRLNENPSHK